MELKRNQPISELYVPDNSYSRTDEELFKIKFGLTDWIYIQFDASLCGGPIAADDIVIYNETGKKEAEIGLLPTQTLNGTDFTIKFRFSDLELPSGCYYIQWKTCPSDDVFTTTPTHRTNLFHVTSDLRATKLVTATCSCNGFGFDWSVFALSFRVGFAMFNPEYDIDMEDYLQSDMVNKKYYVERGKFYNCRTAAMGEQDHDAFSLMLLCEQVLIDGVEYYLWKKDYNLVDWQKAGQTLLSAAEFQLKKQGDVPVNNNCQDCDSENYYYYG